MGVFLVKIISVVRREKIYLRILHPKITQKPTKYFKLPSHQLEAVKCEVLINTKIFTNSLLKRCVWYISFYGYFVMCNTSTKVKET